MKSKCSKCGYESPINKEKFGLPLCSICYTFAPNTPEEIDKYLEEKANSKFIECFRKYSVFPGELQRKGMISKASQGKSMSRPAFGYKYEKGKLVLADNWKEVEDIFEGFLKEKTSLRKIAKKHKFSVNGLKKILRNYTYIGKIRFNNQIYNGSHKPIISSTLFNHVQNKLDKLERKKK